MKRVALLAIVLGAGLLVPLTLVDVSQAQVAATQVELLAADSADAGFSGSLASVFGLARWALLLLAYLVAVTLIERV